MEKKFIVYLQLFILSMNVVYTQEDCICGLVRENFSYRLDYNYKMTNSYLYSILEDIVVQYQKYASNKQLPQVRILRVENETIQQDKRTATEKISRDSLNNLPRAQDQIHKKHIYLSYNQYEFHVEIGAQQKQQVLRSKYLFETLGYDLSLKKNTVDFKYTSLEFNPSNQKRGFMYYSVCKHFMIFIRKFSTAITNRYIELHTQKESSQNAISKDQWHYIVNQGNQWINLRTNLFNFTDRQDILGFRENKTAGSLAGCKRDVEFDERKVRMLALMEFSQMQITQKKIQPQNTKIVYVKRQIIMDNRPKKKKRKQPAYMRLYQDSKKRQQTNVQTQVQTSNQSREKKAITKTNVSGVFQRLSQGGQSNSMRKITSNKKNPPKKNQVPVRQINLDLDAPNTQQKTPNQQQKTNISSGQTTNHNLQINQMKQQQRNIIQNNLLKEVTVDESTSEEYEYEQSQSDDNMIVYEQHNNLNIQQHQVMNEIVPNTNVQPNQIQPELVEDKDIQDEQIIANQMIQEYQESFLTLNLNIQTLSQDNLEIAELSPDKQKLFDYFMQLIVNEQDLYIINLLYKDFQKQRSQNNSVQESQLIDPTDKDSLVVFFQNTNQIDEYIYQLFELRKDGFFKPQNAQLNQYQLVYDSSTSNFIDLVQQIQQPGQNKFQQDVLAFISYFVQINVEEKKVKNLKVYKHKNSGQVFTNLEFNYENVRYGSLIYESIMEGGYIGCAEEIAFEQTVEYSYQLTMNQENLTTGETFNHFQFQSMGQVLGNNDDGLDNMDKEQFLKYLQTVDPSIKISLDQIQSTSQQMNVNFNGKQLYLVIQLIQQNQFDKFIQLKCTNTFLQQFYQ